MWQKHTIAVIYIYINFHQKIISSENWQTNAATNVYICIIFKYSNIQNAMQLQFATKLQNLS